MENLQVCLSRPVPEQYIALDASLLLTKSARNACTSLVQASPARDYATTKPPAAYMQLKTENLRNEKADNSPCLQAYLWIVVLHGIVAWLDAYGIGKSTRYVSCSSRALRIPLRVSSVAIAILLCPAVLDAGANDVANAFGTSVGSKTLKIWSACCIAAVFEFTGAVTLGGQVTKTVAGSIANTSTFEGYPAVFMYGMFCAETGAMIWILFATYLELPVSTTHSISKWQLVIEVQQDVRRMY
jgi:hypothetical protein